MGYLLRDIMSFRQEMADFAQGTDAHFRTMIPVCNANFTAADTISLPADDCLNCYPSPDRFASSRRLPVTLFAHLAKNGWNGFAALAFPRQLTDSVTVTTPIKGRKSCLKHLGSSLQLLCLASPPASKTTLNARSWALALAALLAKLSATTTALKAHLLAALSAHLPTTSKVTRLHYSTKINEIAAAGQPCARRFCF